MTNRVPPTKTFKDAQSALANAKKLLAKGDISRADYARAGKKLASGTKTYPGRK